MTVESRVRRAVARRVWRGNPHSAALALVCLDLAQLIDQGRNEPQLAEALRLTMSHLVDCGAEPDDLDEIRARHCRNRLALLSTEAPDLH